MMARYVAIASPPDPTDQPTQQVGAQIYVDEGRPPVKTGLLNHLGVPIYRLQNPVGFNR